MRSFVGPINQNGKIHTKCWQHLPSTVAWTQGGIERGSLVSVSSFCTSPASWPTLFMNLSLLLLLLPQPILSLTLEPSIFEALMKLQNSASTQSLVRYDIHLMDQIAPGFGILSMKRAIAGLPRSYHVHLFNKSSSMCIHIIDLTSLEDCNSIFKKWFLFNKNE